VKNVFRGWGNHIGLLHLVIGESLLEPILLPVLSEQRFFWHSDQTRFERRRFLMTNIYVGNLSFRQTEEELRTSFEAYGAVTSVKIVKDRETGRSRGFAFVEMPNADEAQQAIEGLNNQSVGGRQITVNEARPKPAGGGGGGGGGGYRGGGGGGGDRPRRY
jgi:RNA recognition motif-containing protein